jgi:hypothetical protein
MDDPNTTTTGILKADEDILTYTASDEVLEAAASIGAGNEPSLFMCDYPYSYSRLCPE